MQLEQPIAGYTGKPQTEDGFTRIANELLEAICFADLSKRQYKIMLSLIRQTYGYGKKTDDITISQLADKTGMALSHASATVKELITMQVITFSGNGQHGKILSINKHYDTWEVTETVSYRNGNVTKTVSECYQNGNNGLPKRSFEVTETVNTIDNPKRKSQKIIPIEKAQPKKPAAVICPQGVDGQVWADFLLLRKTKKASLTETALKTISREADKAGVSLQTALETCCARGWVGFKADWVTTLARGSPKKAGIEKYLDNFRDIEKEFENERDITGVATRVD